MEKTSSTQEERSICDSCGNEIDPDWCHCGERIDTHNLMSGHNPVPMGCGCGRVPHVD